MHHDGILISKKLSSLNIIISASSLYKSGNIVWWNIDNVVSVSVKRVMQIPKCNY